MDCKIQFSSLAQKELENSNDWYEERSVGLGDRFADVIAASVNKILKNPTAYPKKKGDNREFQVDKFPFVIVYRYIEKTDVIRIVHVFHTKRNPALKY